MSKDPLIVRPSGPHDFEAMLAMKSDPEDIKWSGFAGAPTRENLKAWFDRKLADPTNRLFVGYVNDDAAAYAHFHRDSDKDRFDMSYGVAPRHRGRGLATELLIETTSQMTKSGNVNPGYQAWIAVGNIGSEKAAELARFFATAQEKDQEFLYPERRTDKMRLWIQRT